MDDGYPRQVAPALGPAALSTLLHTLGSLPSDRWPVGVSLGLSYHCLNTRNTRLLRFPCIAICCPVVHPSLNADHVPLHARPYSALDARDASSLFSGLIRCPRGRRPSTTFLKYTAEI